MSRLSTANVSRVLGGIRASRLGSAAWAIGTWAVVAAVGAAVGAATVENRLLGLALAGLILVIGIYFADPLVFVVIALPGALLIQRVGGSSTNLSIADLLVFVGGVISLFHIKWSEATFLRQFLRGVVWYQAILILVVVAHPNRYNIVEWFHRFSYLGATVLIGWVIATSGRTRSAFRLFLGGASILAVITMGYAVKLHFQPAQWGVYQKNAIGSLLWVAVVVAQINPPWAGISRRLARVSKYLCIAGLLACQSRQAAIVGALALVVAYLLNPEVRSRSRLIVVALVPVVIVLYYSFSSAAKNNPKFNSVSIRFSQISAAVHVWHLSPVLGEGMRFYNLPQYAYVTAPPNVVIDNLASTGLVGSVAFLFLVFITMRTMFRLPYALGTLGLVILLAHYVDGLFDIFWIGGPTVAPIIIAGISLGFADMARRAPPGSELDLLAHPVVAPTRPATGGAGRRDRLTLRSVGRSLSGTIVHPVQAWLAPSLVR
jgi:hypothetical protein